MQRVWPRGDGVQHQTDAISGRGADRLLQVPQVQVSFVCKGSHQHLLSHHKGQVWWGHSLWGQ